jgi:hypothetical protein
MGKLSIEESIKWTKTKFPSGVSFSWPENTRVSQADHHFTLYQMTFDRLDQVLENNSFPMDPLSYAT